jgi:SAM-dependent methyltransferase
MSKLPDHLGGHQNVTNVDTKILPYLVSKYSIKTMVDIGCGPGGMKNIAKTLDISWTGVDGDFTLKDKENIIIHDFSIAELDLEQEFDLAWSSEFLEHVDEKYIDNYMPLFASAKIVVATAALPGTPGHHHVNCKDLDYWIKVFGRYDMIYDELETKNLKRISDMRKSFFRRHGFCFKKK